MMGGRGIVQAHSPVAAAEWAWWAWSGTLSSSLAHSGTSSEESADSAPTGVSRSPLGRPPESFGPDTRR